MMFDLYLVSIVLLIIMLMIAVISSEKIAQHKDVPTANHHHHRHIRDSSLSATGESGSFVSSVSSEGTVHSTATCSQPAPTFDNDIKPLFREFDRNSMLPHGLDLWSYTSVKGSASAIYSRVSTGSMPCDGPWSMDKVTLFQHWMDCGTLEGNLPTMSPVSTVPPTIIPTLPPTGTPVSAIPPTMNPAALPTTPVPTVRSTVKPNSPPAMTPVMTHLPTMNPTSTCPSFNENIKPLFRAFDRSSMLPYGFDLWKYSDVKKMAASIYQGKLLSFFLSFFVSFFFAFLFISTLLHHLLIQFHLKQFVNDV
jgi:hypothetical protein